MKICKKSGSSKSGSKEERDPKNIISFYRKGKDLDRFYKSESKQASQQQRVKEVESGGRWKSPPKDDNSFKTPVKRKISRFMSPSSSLPTLPAPAKIQNCDPVFEVDGITDEWASKNPGLCSLRVYSHTKRLLKVCENSQRYVFCILVLALVLLVLLGFMLGLLVAPYPTVCLIS